MKRSVLLLLCVVLCAAPLGANGAAVDRISSVVAGFQLTTPEENIFRVQGSDKEFVLLDVDSNGDCFILANDFYGTRQFDSVNATAKFDVESPSNIAYFLNHDFLTAGNTTDGKTYQLPEEIVEYIDFDREWKTEAGRGTSDVPNDYTVKAGVVLLSQTEWAQYASKFGDYDPTTTIFGYWLRTSRGKGINQTNAILCARVTDTNGTTNNAPSDKYELIRPAFYLKQEFFTQVKLDVESMGISVNTLLKTKYDKTALERIYTPEEMDVIYQNLPPVATGVGCMGNHYVGQTMHGYYTYEDAEEDKEGTSTFQWYKSKNGASPIPIEGATKIDYTIAEEDVGYQLLLEVTPVNRQGTGSPSQSSLSKEVLKNEPPQALRLYIEGAAYTQNTLIARYDYSDANEDKESGSTIQWYRAAAPEEEAVPIEGAVSKTYEITEEDIGCYLTFSVTPRSQGEENNEGKTQRCAEAVGPVQGLDYAQPSIAQEGEAFRGAYTYVGYGQEEKAVQTGWYIGTTLSGAMTKIPGADQDTYAPRPEDEGYYLAFGTQVEGGRKMLSQRVLMGNQPAAERERGTVQEAKVSFDGAQTVRVTLLARDADFINSASARVIYDPQALQLVEVKSELGSNLQLISGNEGDKTVFLSMGTDVCGLRGDVRVMELVFQAVEGADASVSVEKVCLYKTQDQGIPQISAYEDLILEKEG